MTGACSSQRRRDAGDAVADRFDDAGGLVAEQEGELVVDGALAVMQVRVAHPHAWTATTASPGPGSGTTTCSTVTGAPLPFATTPRTVCAIRRSST